MTSPETPPQAPQRSAFPGDGSWKAAVPTITVLGIFLGVFLATQVALFAWFDNRFASGLDRVEKRLTDRIDRVETELGNRIDEVKADLEASEARQSAAAKRLTAGIAGNRANHRELVGFVRAHYPGAPQPAASEPEPAPAQ